MLKKGSIVLSIWCVINFILAFVILGYVTMAVIRGLLRVFMV